MSLYQHLQEDWLSRAHQQTLEPPGRSNGRKIRGWEHGVTDRDPRIPRSVGLQLLFLGFHSHGGTPSSLDGFCERENPILQMDDFAGPPFLEGTPHKKT